MLRVEAKKQKFVNKKLKKYKLRSHLDDKFDEYVVQGSQIVGFAEDELQEKEESVVTAFDNDISDNTTDDESDPDREDSVVSKTSISKAGDIEMQDIVKTQSEKFMGAKMVCFNTLLFLVGIQNSYKYISSMTDKETDR